MQTIKFDDIRVGDVIEVRATYYSGDAVSWQGAVTRRTPDSLETQMFPFARSNNRYKYFLVERPKPTFKVGDTITGDQVKDLPDGAVFNLRPGRVDLRYKIYGYVYTAQGSVIPIDAYTASDYCDIKIVFLPEEG